MIRRLTHLTAAAVMACTLCLVIAGSASAQEVGSEQWNDDVSIESIEANVFNGVFIRFNGTVQCGSFGTRPTAYIHATHAGSARELLYRTLLSAWLAGRRIDISLVQYTVSGADYCVVKRVRMR